MKDETLAETDPPDLGKYVKSFSPLIIIDEKKIRSELAQAMLLHWHKMVAKDMLRPYEVK